MEKRLYRFFFNLPELICSILLSAIIALNLVAVFMRYVVGNPITWNEEVTLGLYVWMVMLGSACVIKRNASIKLDFLVGSFPSGLRRALQALIAAGALIFFVMLAKYALELSALTKNRTSVFKIHYAWIYASIVAAAAFNAWFLILRIMRIVKGKNLNLAWSSREQAEQERLMAAMYGAAEFADEEDAQCT